MTRRPFAIPPKMLLAALALVLLALLGQHVHQVIPWVEGRIEALGPLAPVGLAALCALGTPLLVPGSVFGVLAGMLFGLAEGTGLYFVGTCAGCAIAFALARGLLRQRVEARIERQPRIAAVTRAAQSHGLELTVLLRLAPINAATISYALGVADVSWKLFLLGSLAMLPTLFVSVYTGVAAKHVTHMAAAGHTNWTADGAALVGGLVVCGAAIAFIYHRVQEAVHEASGATPAPGAPGD